MSADNSSRSSRRGSLALGATLVVLGTLFVLGQMLDIDVGGVAWPLFIILPGILLFVVGVVAGDGFGEVVAIVGSIATMTGVLLFVQDTLNYYDSWAYAWALVVPTSIGLGRMLFGWLKGNQRSVQAGKKLAAIGGIIFLVGAIFFELVIGLGGFSIGGSGLAILLIGLGAFFILRSFLPGSATPPEAATETADSTPQASDIEEMSDE